MTKQAIVRLQLDAAAKQQLDQFCDKRGMTKIAVLARLLKWFTKQDQLVQASILNHLRAENLRELAEISLRRTGKSKARSKTSQPGVDQD